MDSILIKLQLIRGVFRKLCKITIVAWRGILDEIDKYVELSTGYKQFSKDGKFNNVFLCFLKLHINVGTVWNGLDGFIYF